MSAGVESRGSSRATRPTSRPSSPARRGRSSPSAAARSGRSAGPSPPMCSILRALAGIVSYEPAELVLTARAATPLAAIESALASHAPAARIRAARFRRAARRQLFDTIGAADDRRRARGEPRRLAPRDGRRRARSLPGLSSGQRPRRGVQSRRQGRQERHGLRPAEAARGLVGHAGGADGSHATRRAGTRARPHARRRGRLDAASASRCSARRCARRTTCPRPA